MATNLKKISEAISKSFKAVPHGSDHEELGCMIANLLIENAMLKEKIREERAKTINQILETVNALHGETLEKLDD